MHMAKSRTELSTNSLRPSSLSRDLCSTTWARVSGKWCFRCGLYGGRGTSMPSWKDFAAHRITGVP